MNEFKFQAIGTKWVVSTDGATLSQSDKEAVLSEIDAFEKKFSRFLPESESNSFREAKTGDFEVSEEFSRLLHEADRLRKLTDGAYDPAVAGFLEKAGYGMDYSLKPSPETENFVLPKWSISGRLLALSGPISFDFGGIGKGYLIDKVSDILLGLGYRYFTVDGGGDIFTTTKENGAPWKAAIQYPGKPDIVAGTINLKNEGLAVSDSFARRWGKWHHIVDHRSKKSVEYVIGAAAVAPSAFWADCMTSVLFLSAPGLYPAAAEQYKAKYLVFKNDGTATTSSNWDGELF